eukprot:3265161-Rhodomonas_salina.3
MSHMRIVQSKEAVIAIRLAPVPAIFSGCSATASEVTAAVCPRSTPCTLLRTWSTTMTAPEPEPKTNPFLLNETLATRDDCPLMLSRHGPTTLGFRLSWMSTYFTAVSKSYSFFAEMCTAADAGSCIASCSRHERCSCAGAWGIGPSFPSGSLIWGVVGLRTA